MAASTTIAATLFSSVVQREHLRSKLGSSNIKHSRNNSNTKQQSTILIQTRSSSLFLVLPPLSKFPARKIPTSNEAMESRTHRERLFPSAVKVEDNDTKLYPQRIRISN